MITNKKRFRIEKKGTVCQSKEQKRTTRRYETKPRLCLIVDESGEVWYRAISKSFGYTGVLLK